MRRSRRRLRRLPWMLLLALLVMVALAPLAPLAQEAERKEEPIASGMVEGTESRLIQLDVSFAPKKKGDALAIPQLGPEDFDVVINARTIRVEYADRICNVEQREILAPADSVEPESPVAPAAPPAVRRANTFVFYFEHTLLTMSGQNIALEMAERLIPELIVQGNRGMVISSGSRVVQTEFATEPEPLLAAIRDIRKDTAQWSEYTYAQNEEVRYQDIRRQPTIGSQRIAARAYQLEEARTTGNRMRRLSATIGGLAEIDPPKALFYFADIARKRPGEHYVKTFSGGAGEPKGSDSEDSALAHSFEFDRVLGEANAQGVRLYTIQAQGMQVIPVWEGASSPNDTSLGLTRSREAENTMSGFAAETGGEMFFGGTDASTMGKIERQIEQDFGCFYVLSFHPTDLPEDQPLRVLLRMHDTERGRAADTRFEIRTRGQLVVQSPSRREQSLLLAAHVVSGAVDADPGRSVAIPLGFSRGVYQALVQFVVRGTDLPGGGISDCLWDLGMTHVSGTDIAGEVSARVGADQAAAPVVLETLWEFHPGQSEIVSVGREHRLGQLATAQLNLDWPDLDKSKASVAPIAVVQEVDGVFLRKAGQQEEAVRPRGTLGVGQGQVRVDQPAYLIGLICRGPRMQDALWVQRRLVGESSAEFELLKWEFSGERCIQLRDLVHEGQMSWGDFTYEIQVFDNEELDGAPIASGSHAFTALNDSEWAMEPSSPRPGP